MKKTKREWFKGSDYNLIDRIMFGTWAVLGITYLVVMALLIVFGPFEMWFITMK